MTDEQLIELASNAFRQADPRTGRITPHEAWRDLDEAGRRALFEETRTSRLLEAGLDPDGLSTTARAVLDRIRR